MLHTAYIGAGSNMGSPRENCERALENLESHPHITLTARSSFYETEPVGMSEQNWFINAAAEVKTSLEPGALLEELLNIERDMGRVRSQKWGPRIIDLDLLLYEDRIYDEPGLQLPRRDVLEYSFVLRPLAELAPSLVHPVTGKSIASQWAEYDKDSHPLTPVDVIL